MKVEAYSREYFRPGTLERYDGRSYYYIQLKPESTAVLVVDPWSDNPTEHLNNYYGRITEKYICPLVRYSLDMGFTVFVVTNDPSKENYSAEIHPCLRAMEEDENFLIHYHRDDGRLPGKLRDRELSRVVLTGFASNRCLLMLMMDLRALGEFELYFVPEASAAVEYRGSWETGSLHRAMTIIISQWAARIIHWDDFMKQG